MAARGRGKKSRFNAPRGNFDDGLNVTGVSDALIKQARKSGMLNLSNRSLEEVPSKVWRINIDVPDEGKTVSLDEGGDRWWEQIDLTKLILVSNKLTTIDDGVVNLPALSVLDAHDNRINLISESIGQLTQLVKLNFSHNQLDSLPDCFGKLSLMQILLMSNNKIKDIPENICNLERLEELDMSNNLIESLPSEIGRFKRMRKLNLSNNKLVLLPDGITGMQCLHDLNIGNNQLTELPKGLERLTSLATMDCRNNKIRNFPTLENDFKIKELHFGNNQLDCLPSSQLCYLKSLHILELRDNRISVIPEEISDIQSLQRLDLANNRLSTLPPQMGKMELNSLVLDGNPLKSLRRDIIAKGTQAILKHLKTRLPENLQDNQHNNQQSTMRNGASGAAVPTTTDVKQEFDIHSIKATGEIKYSGKKAVEIPMELFKIDGGKVLRVDFSVNQLKEFPEQLTVYADSLNEINLSKNKISTLPSCLGMFKRLTTIDLSMNLISHLPEDCSQWKSITQLTLSFNRMTAIPLAIYEMPKLENLLICNNQITEIDVAKLSTLKNLLVLDLSNNNISNVPPTLGNLTWLRSLQLEGNGFRNPRATILAKGTLHILEYLRDRIPT